MRNYSSLKKNLTKNNLGFLDFHVNVELQQKHNKLDVIRKPWL